jgi:drug/metabolite transporter (DMT)-like permease
MPENKKSTLIIFLSILGLALIWGSSFILVKKSLVHYSALQVGALRICSASLFFIPIFLKRFKYMEKKHVSSFLLAGLTGNLIPAILFAIAGQHLSSALSGMLNAFTPLFTLIIGILFFAQPFIWKQTTGIFVGLIGCLGLLFAGQGLNIDFNIHGLWVVLATLLYGINMHIVKTRLSDMHPLTSTAGIFMVIGPLALIVLIYTGFFSMALDQEHLWSFIAAMALGLFGSAIGMLAFNQIIKWTSAIVASSVTYMIPIVALGWGFADGESIYFLQVISMFVLLAGIYLVNKSKN